jgi:hypothetical protein
MPKFKNIKVYLKENDLLLIENNDAYVNDDEKAIFVHGLWKEGSDPGDYKKYINKQMKISGYWTNNILKDYIMVYDNVDYVGEGGIHCFKKS